MSELLDRMRQEDKRAEQRQSEPKAEPKKAKTTKKDSKPQGKKKGKKEYYRINLALSQELGETIKAMADAEERSVNNYIERILKDHIERR